MKAYLIDPVAKSITQVEYSGEYTNIYEHIQADCFDVVRVNDKGDSIFVDDEGLMKPNAFFLHRNYPSPLAGRGLMLGLDYASGESVEPVCSIEELRQDIVFMSRAELVRWLDEQPIPF
jgi:hypothetical protein